MEAIATLAAKCHFKDIGTIKITEKLEELQYTEDISAPGGCSKRYLIFETDRLSSLCPRSTYTLTIHEYDNVDCKCKNVGPLLGGVRGILSETLAIGTKGQLENAF